MKKYFLSQFLFFWLICLNSTSAQTLTSITTLPVTLPSLCVPIYFFNVSYTTNGSANPGNIYYAQLSDENGSFANPTIIGSQSNNQPSIQCSLTNLCCLGNPFYYIRVVSTNPVIIGSISNYLEFVPVIPKPVLTFHAGPNTFDSGVCSGLSNQFTVGGYVGPSGCSQNCAKFSNIDYHWNVENGVIINGRSTITASFNPVSYVLGRSVSLYFTGTLGCASAKDSIVIPVYPTDDASYSINGNTSICNGDSVVLTSTNTLLYGSSLTFDGVDDYVNIVGQPALGSHFTEEAWIYSSSPPDSTYHGVIGSLTTDSTKRPPSLYIYNDNNGVRVSGGFGDGSVFKRTYSTPHQLTLNKWFHVAMTFDSLSLKLYVNGFLVCDDSSFAGHHPYNTSLTRIGGFDGFFNGKIDEVKIWNVARTADEIRKFMDYKLVYDRYWNNYTGLLLDYTMNEMSGTVLLNSEGNRISGSLGSSPCNPQWNLTPPYVGYSWNSGETSPSINVKSSGNYSLTFTNQYGCSSINLPNTTVVQIPPPSQIGPIITVGGDVKVCPTQTKNYSVDSIPGTTYFWTVPVGATILVGQGTSKVGVWYTNTFTQAGNLTVAVSNSCGSQTFTLLIERNDPPQPVTISGLNYGVCSLSNVIYSISAVTGYSYLWTTSTPDAVITSAQNKNFIKVNFSPAFITGTISLSLKNSCGTSVPRIKTVYAKPTAPSTITGSSSVCANQLTVPYSIPLVNNTTSYTWVGPSGSRISDGVTISTSNSLITTATSVNVNFSTSAGVVKARANNTCGSGSYKSLAVSIVCREADDLINNDDSQFDVYPNPASDEITLSFYTNEKESFAFTITDILGKEIITSEGISHIGENKIITSLQDISPGIYFVNMTHGNYSMTKKMVVE